MIKASTSISTVVHRSHWNTEAVRDRLNRFQNAIHLSQNLDWCHVLENAFSHPTMVIEARADGKTVGLLPLAEVSSLLFGRFLVSLPYVNSAGILCESEESGRLLIDRAVKLADELDVSYLELRHENECRHPNLNQSLATKALMRLPLPSSPEQLWSTFKSKLRSQIRSGERNGFSVHWGGAELLDSFYAVFSKRMRELGTPVYGKKLFRSILECFPDSAEMCCVKSDGETIAAALLVHGPVKSEVPSASSIRKMNSKNANMWMYWQLLKRSIERGNSIFDFGRSTIDSGTYQFKKQWGAKPTPCVWQYYLRKGKHDALRPENGKYSLATTTWRYLPLTLTKWIGPMIVRGIP